MNDGSDGVLVFAVGDVFVDREDLETAFSGVPDTLSTADVLFGNCEGVFADATEMAPSCGVPLIAPAVNAARLASAGFTVLSLANNHSVDGGHAGLLSMRETFERLGIAVAGAGADLAAAREPAIVVRSGMSMAFLAYSSVFPYGYEARTEVPGIAPMRSHTRYTPWELNEWSPGMLPRITTDPVSEDLEALGRDIRKARERSDMVFTSFHWGDVTRPFVLTDHERFIAHYAIDEGATAVFGHHHHMLRGVEIYNGKPIFYGLGHYLFDVPNLPKRLQKGDYLVGRRREDELAERRRWGKFQFGPRDGYPLLPFHEDSRMTGIAILRVRDDGLSAVGFQPAVINPDNNPIGVSADSVDGRRVVDYLRACNNEEEISSRLVAPTAESELPRGCVQILAG